jgi:Bacterial PH domain
MATVNQAFQSAPMGRRVILTSVVALGAGFLGFAANLVAVLVKAHHAPTRARMIEALGLLVPVVIFGISYMWERAKGAQISIEDNTLVLRKKRYPLEGLKDAIRDPDVLKGARRRFGNSGLGMIRGKYVSKRLGKFDAFLTDPGSAVVLTWPDRVVAVSPSDPEFFVYSARSAAGLR